MILILAATLLVLAIAFYQVLQGLFSALIMAILTIVSAVVAFEFYEPLASGLFYNKFSAYADGTCLATLFLVTLLALRVVFDLLIRGNVVVGPWADRLGGGALGLLTGTIVLGVLLVAVQMLPFGETVLGLRPFDASLQRDQSAGPLRSDEFTLGLVKMLSAGSLSGSRSYAQEHPTLLLDEFCARNTAGKHGRSDAPADSAKDVAVYQPSPQDLSGELAQGNIPPNPLLDKNDPDRIYILRGKVTAEAADGDNWFRLPATHFRLVTNLGHSCYPVAYLTGSEVDAADKEVSKGWKLHAAPMAAKEGEKARVGELLVERPSTKERPACVIDWVYRVPAGENETPEWLVFRRSSKCYVGNKGAYPSGLPTRDGALNRKAAAKPPH